MVIVKSQKHFVLVHGACHGAWSWYKLKPLLEAAGHSVTAFDLAASGINLKAIQDVRTLEEYTEPLFEFLASLQSDDKVILVGHSLGGLSLALAMEKFSEKIAVAVFLTAFMPDTANKPSYVLDQYCQRTPAEAWLDTQFLPYSDSQKHLTTMFFGPNILSQILYQLSPNEDLELARMVSRPGSLFLHDLSNSKNFSNEGYGSVTRVYVVCEEDKAIPLEFQRWMIKNYPVAKVMEIKEADHMPMFSTSRQLCDCLSKVANDYA